METKDSFTICVLLYGNYTDLAHRCLSSLARACPEALPQHLRVGLNEISPRTEKYVDSLVQNGWLLEENIWRSAENIHKYPMMRRMFYDPDRPVTTPYVMWFDDDSYIKDEMVGEHPTFLEQVRAVFTKERKPPAALCGAVYNIPMMGGQIHWIEDQKWYTGKKVRKQARFVTGGWWTADFSFIKEHDYPWELDHRGGDVMLGQLVDQQGRCIVNFRDGLAINADSHGNESKSTRRGFDQRPMGIGYRRPASANVATPATKVEKPDLQKRVEVSQAQAAHIANTIPPAESVVPPTPEKPKGLLKTLDL
jgi:hypothetical protein